MADWIDALRYDHPYIYRVGMSISISVVVLLGFLFLPESPMLRAMGVTGFQTRVSAFTNALYWSSRARMNGKSTTDTPKVFYGNMEGVDASGKLIVTVAEGGHWVRHLLCVADVVLTDIYGVAWQVGALRLEDAKFEVYRDDQAVIWVRGVPFNVKLIEAGVAKPDPTPPTNIVDVAFATYYWGIAKGKPLNPITNTKENAR